MFDILPLIIQGPPVQWLVLDCAAIGDIDYTASAVLAQAVQHVQQRHIRFAFSSVLGPVRQQLDLYGISKTLDHDACYDTAGAALEAFQARQGTAPAAP
jgi:anti-anti-sigma regulatory factor